MPLYTQWILNTVYSATGKTVVRIARGTNDFNGISAANTVRLHNNNHFLLKAAAQVTKEKNTEDADIIFAEIDLEFLDRETANGVCDGSEVSIALTGQTTLWQYIFGDDSLLYHVCVDDYDSAGTRETIFIGSFYGRDIVCDEDAVIRNAQTTGEYKLGEYKVKVYSAIEQLKNKKVGTDLIPAFSGTDMQLPDGTMPFYCGISTGNENSYDPDLQTEIGKELKFNDATSLTNELIGTGSAQWWDSNRFQLASHQNYNDEAYAGYDGTFPHGSWGISIPSIVNKICGICGLKSFAVADFELGLIPLNASFNNSTNVFSVSQLTNSSFAGSATLASELTVEYNVWFGVSPEDGSNWQNPCSIAWDATMMDVIKRICLDYGCYCYPYYDTTNRTCGLKIQSRKKNAGSIPAAWKREGGCLSHKEEPRATGHSAVHVTNRGAEGGVTVTTGRGGGETLEIEISTRARAWGGQTAPAFAWKDFELNSKLGPMQQWLCSRRNDNGKDNKLNDDGWVTGSYSFFRWQDPASSGSDIRGFYPRGESDKIWSYLDTFINIGAGHYNIWGWIEDSGVSAPYTDRFNSLVGHAYFYATELLSYPLSYIRRYSGCRHDDGKLNSVVCGMRDTWFERSANRTFEAMKVTLDREADETEILWSEVNTSTDGLALKWDGASGLQTGSTGGPTGNNGGDQNPLLPQNNVSGALELLSVDYAVDTLAHKITTNPDPTLQLIWNEGDARDNGVYYVTGMGAATTKRPYLFKYGCRILAEESYNNEDGQQSTWELVGEAGALTPGAQQLSNSDVSLYQYWQRCDRINNLFDTAGSQVTRYHNPPSGSAYWNPAGGLSVRSVNDKIPITVSFRDPGGFTGEKIPDVLLGDISLYDEWKYNNNSGYGLTTPNGAPGKGYKFDNLSGGWSAPPGSAGTWATGGGVTSFTANRLGVLQFILATTGNLSPVWVAGTALYIYVSINGTLSAYQIAHDLRTPAGPIAYALNGTDAIVLTPTDVVEWRLFSAAGDATTGTTSQIWCRFYK